MKFNIIRYILPALAIAVAAGCTDWNRPEAILIGDHTDLTSTDKDNAYYQALREYKASDHEISFGWYSRWDEPALTTDGMLQGIPDSMDVVSLWSNSRNLSEARMKDLRFVQEVKGTKVLVCSFAQYVGCGFTPEEHNGSEEDREAFWGWVDGDEAAISSAIAKYAAAIRDTVAYYGYDGLDIDFEPNYDGVTGKLDENQEYVEILFSELSKYFGPKSGTGLLFVVDGEIPNVPPSTSEYFDYFVVQAYTVASGSPNANATGYESNMDSRLSAAVNRFSGYLTEEEVTNRYVVTENLESAIDALNGGFFWQTRDGVRQDKKKIPSMLGMAMWQPANGFRKGGFGGYRFDNEATNDPSYKWMRAGIQAQNPASGERRLAVRFDRNSETVVSVSMNDDMTLPYSSIEDEFYLQFTGFSGEAVKFSLSYEPSLVAEYNEANGTDFAEFDVKRLTLPEIQVNKDASKSETVKVTADISGMSKGRYLIPVKVNLPEGSCYYSDGDLVRYIKVSISFNNVVTDGTPVTGVKITPADSWRLKCYNGYNTSGWSGVWNNDADWQQAAMLDGSYSTYWYSNSNYFNPGNFIVEMDKEYTISGFRWQLAYGPTYDQFDITDIQISNDRENWESISNETRFTPVVTTYTYEDYPDYPDYIIELPLKNPVSCRYFRVIVATSYYVSMYQAEMWGPAE